MHGGRVHPGDEPPGRCSGLGDDGLGVPAGQVRMCSQAASTASTTATARSRDRYSSAQSSSCAAANGIPAATAYGSIAPSPCRVTPFSARAARTRGRKASATSACTSRVSAVLHTLVRWVLAFSDDRQGLVEVGCGVDVDVAVAHAGLDHRHGRIGHDAADQAGAATRDQQVHQPSSRHQRVHGGVAAPRHELHRVLGHVGAGQRRAHDRDQGCVGLVGRRRPAQQGCVAALERQSGRIHGDVGAGLVDHGHHTHRHAHLADLQAVGLRPPRTTSPTGSGRSATSSRASAISASRASVRVSRSTMPGAVPASRARCTSRALAASTWSVESRSPWAIARRAASFWARWHRRRATAAARARRAVARTASRSAAAVS